MVKPDKFFASEKEAEWVSNDPLGFFAFKYGVKRSPYLDNEMYYPAHSTKKRYVVFQGGRGSAKSHSIGWIIVVKMSVMPHFVGVLIRQIKATVKDSVWQDVVSYIRSCGLEKFFTIQDRVIYHKLTGAKLLYGGMDKPDSYKSVHGLTHVFLEEAYSIVSKNERFDHRGISEIEKSIRSSMFRFTKQMFFVYNPYHPEHWLYAWFWSDNPDHVKKHKYKRENSFRLITNFRHNKFLDAATRERYEADKEGDPEIWRVDGCGLWGNVKVKGLYYKWFERNYKAKISGLKEKRYDTNIPIHVSFDFNVGYIAMLIHQIQFDEESQTLDVLTIEEICIEDFQISEVMEEFFIRYKNHKGDVYVYGDRSGHNRKLEGVTDYATVFKCLGFKSENNYANEFQNGKPKLSSDLFDMYERHGATFNSHDRTLKSNPSVKARQIMINRMHLDQFAILPVQFLSGNKNRRLSEQYGTAKVRHYIDAACTKLIRDFEKMREDILTGGKNKKDLELTHTSDSLEYLFCKFFDAELDSIISEMKR